VLDSAATAGTGSHQALRIGMCIPSSSPKPGKPTC
jgi:hypothetical protein